MKDYSELRSSERSSYSWDKDKMVLVLVILIWLVAVSFPL